MFAIFDTKTNKVVFSDDSKAKVLEVFNKTMPDNKGDVYNGYKIVKIETCVNDTDDELYDEIVDLDRTFYAWNSRPIEDVRDKEIARLRKALKEIEE